MKCRLPLSSSVRFRARVGTAEPTTSRGPGGTVTGREVPEIRAAGLLVVVRAESAISAGENCLPLFLEFFLPTRTIDNVSGCY